MSTFELTSLSEQGQEYFGKVKASHPDQYDDFVAAFIAFQSHRLDVFEMVSKVRNLFMDDDDDGFMMIDFNQFLPEGVRFFRADGFVIAPSPGYENETKVAVTDDSVSEGVSNAVGFMIKAREVLSQEQYYKVMALINASQPFDEKVTDFCVLLGDHPELVQELNKCVPTGKAFRVENGKVFAYNA